MHKIGGVQNDALRFVLHGVKTDLVGSHPVQSIYESAIATTVCFPGKYTRLNIIILFVYLCVCFILLCSLLRSL
uniref:Uncharacterized protein n=1 Tax=Gossypium raimondii TaxID=29730 RepID=A0A0D2MLK9_GOSRA|nr:hypothetical protein B456_003G095200 [Gossypium raimondii]KJB19322.1 hypothetical protein B456_003G095200 [Gossypium raimondii]